MNSWVFHTYNNSGDPDKMINKDALYMDGLIEAIKGELEKTEGEWAVVLEDLDNGQVWKQNEWTPFYAASVIKLPIMATVFAMAENEQFSLEDSIVVKQADLVGGAGVLQQMTPGIKLSIYDLLMLMIIQSDNTATNILIDLVRMETIQQTMTEIGMTNSRIYNKLMTVPVDPEGRNMITCADMSLLLKKMVTGRIISLHVCEQMVAIMKKQQIQTGLTDALPDRQSNLVGVRPDWELASKSGQIKDIQHEVGIFYVGGRTMIIAVLSKNCSEHLAKETLTTIGSKIYTHLNEIH